jgi:hypothetical protein
MTIDKIHSRINFIRDQETGGYNTPAEIDLALDMGSIWCFNDYASVYAVNQTAKEALSPFIYLLDFTTDSTGVYVINSNLNFLKLLSMDVVVNDPASPSYVQGHNRYFPVDIPGEDEVANRINSQLNPPGATAPVCIVTGQGAYKLYPAQVHAGKLRFLRRPAAPVFGYTEAGRVITYNSGTSTQLEWNDMFINKVIAKALNILGVNLDNDKLVAYGLQWPKENI